jgi:hypothetical protein
LLVLVQVIRILEPEQELMLEALPLIK